MIHRCEFCLIMLLFFMVACRNEEDKIDTHPHDTVITLSVRAVSSAINQDNILWEDRVDELRLITFNAETGEVSYNEKLYFPDGFNSQSKPIRLRAGIYNMYFIANETVYSGDFVAALLNIRNESEFTTDSRFTNLAYNPDFLPDATSVDGRFIMSAIYTDVAITGGGTETNPAPLILPTGKVELVRALAKVEVIFRKKTSGSTVPENTVTSVLLENVASVLSVPPLDNYYEGATVSTPAGSLAGFDYTQDSIGTVVFYIPEFLVSQTGTNYTLLEINNQSYPIETDPDRTGITSQRRTIPSISGNSVVRNYNYKINAYVGAQGGIQLQVYVEPWIVDGYTYLYQGDQQIVIPPVEPTDSSIIITTECGKVEILAHNEYLGQGLQGAYNDVVNYYDPEIQGPTIYKGEPPYYCEKKYGAGWRLINSCELLSFLGVLDATYNVWLSNTWLAADHNMPFYSIYFRQRAQTLLEALTGEDLSGTVLFPENNREDEIADTKLGIVDQYFTPGDIMLREMDFPGGWPFAAPPGTDLEWFYNQASIQVKAFWYDSGYLSPAIRDNWDEILYSEFERYDYSSTVSRCVRVIN